MFTVLAKSGVETTNASFDDCNVWVMLQHWRTCWEDTLQFLLILAKFGFAINLRKCKFLVRSAPILGLDLCITGFVLDLKYMGSLHKMDFHTDLRGLQSFFGKFMYASAHMPHNKQWVHAIEKLLTCKGEWHWTV